MHWFLDPITKHYADFEGRVGRQEYWMFVLFCVLIQIAFDVIGLDMIGLLVSLGLLVPSIALAARRLHDTGRSGWWQLLGLIPIIGWIILIVWLATKTDVAANEYGEPASPKMPSGTTPSGATPATVATPAAASDTATVSADSIPSHTDTGPGTASTTDGAAGADGSN